jgi:streptomycin 6-kinase
VEVPDAVRAKALTNGASAWLDALPSLVSGLTQEWGCTVGTVYPDATEAYVVGVALGDGTPAVLKLMIPRAADYAAHEITVLRLAGGDGCVRLLRYDLGLGAMLLERLGPSLSTFGFPYQRRLEILVDAARRVWRPAPDCGLPSGADKGRWLAEYIAITWEKLDRPCTERAVAYALECVARRIAAHDDGRAVLVHGDVHQWNALRSGAGFALVDPDGLLAEPEYDLGVLLREDPVELMAGDPFGRANWLGARTGLDPTAIWEWGVVERVSSGLMCTSIDLQPVGREMLAAADAVALRSGT